MGIPLGGGHRAGVMEVSLLIPSGLRVKVLPYILLHYIFGIRPL